MAGIQTAIADLFKHFVISQEWSTDKHTNTLVNGVWLACLATLTTITWSVWWTRLNFYCEVMPWLGRVRSMMCCLPKKKSTIPYYIVSQSMTKEFSQRLETAATIRASWNTGTAFDTAIAQFVLSYYTWKFPVFMVYNFVDNSLDKQSNLWTRFVRIVNTKMHSTDPAFPIYANGLEVVGIQCDHEGITFAATSETFLMQFTGMIREKYIPTQSIGGDSKHGLESLSVFGPRITKLYPDRTMENLITRHKPILLRHLEDFRTAQRGKSAFNGFGTYNLGIMVHGPPGTGKTKLALAIANHLQRDVEMVNLRTIKSMTALRDIFCDLHHKVFAFEEFDFVQGVLDFDHKQEHNDDKKQIRARIIQLMTSLNANIDADGRKAIQALIEKEENSLRELDDAITLDNLLMLFDGLQEMRGRVIIATTNHIQKINPALLREGRFDLNLEFGCFDRDETHDLLVKMFPGEVAAASIQAAKSSFPHEKFTPVQLISLCHQHSDLSRILQALVSLSDPRGH
jgi:hypothetical protein